MVASSIPRWANVFPRIDDSHYTPTKRMFFFGGSILESAYLSVCLSMCPSVQYTSFCHSAGGGIKSHLVTALLIRPQNECFRGGGVFWNKPVCLSVCSSVHVFVCAQNMSFRRSACRSIMSHSVTALVSTDAFISPLTGFGDGDVGKQLVALEK